MQAVTADDPGEMHARISGFRGLGVLGFKNWCSKGFWAVFCRVYGVLYMVL